MITAGAESAIKSIVAALPERTREIVEAMPKLATELPCTEEVLDIVERFHDLISQGKQLNPVENCTLVMACDLLISEVFDLRKRLNYMVGLYMLEQIKRDQIFGAPFGGDPYYKLRG